MKAVRSLIDNAITKGASGTLALNLCNQAFIFLTLALLARLLTPEDFGLYAVILSTMSLIALPFMGGFTTFMMRYVAAYRAKENYNALHGLIKYGLSWIILGSLGFILFAFIFFNIFSENIDQ
ncbi:MAG: oligosaccharide flippase family protein, partial [Pseudomonadota bacterium]